ncbi:uncharacterized protein LOC133173839 [Saccostrea echinata]|uniref:uncharacterized protein LOC133173839 n=1 Tax=Saccostrea echinata TaxID=191078 RepID=UPI002A82033A|nr:uncharacterized protein LOC133173839 [Saccostrea echinata]
MIKPLLKMILLNVILMLCFQIKEIFSCQPRVSHRQQLYCSSNYVFQVQAEGVDNKGDDLFERNYRVSVIDSYKGRIGTDFNGTITGNGYFMSCGPQILDKGFKYLIYAYNLHGSIRIREFYNMTDIKKTDIDLFRKYDCFCQIVTKKNGVILRNLRQGNTCSSPIPSGTTCSYRKSYCRRNKQGACEWALHSQCG